MHRGVSSTITTAVLAAALLAGSSHGAPRFDVSGSWEGTFGDAKPAHAFTAQLEAGRRGSFTGTFASDDDDELDSCTVRGTLAASGKVSFRLACDSGARALATARLRRATESAHGVIRGSTKGGERFRVDFEMMKVGR